MSKTNSAYQFCKDELVSPGDVRELTGGGTVCLSDSGGVFEVVGARGRVSSAREVLISFATKDIEAVWGLVVSYVAHRQQGDAMVPKSATQQAAIITLHGNEWTLKQDIDKFEQWLDKNNIGTGLEIGKAKRFEGSKYLYYRPKQACVDDLFSYQDPFEKLNVSDVYKSKKPAFITPEQAEKEKYLPRLQKIFGEENIFDVRSAGPSTLAVLVANSFSRRNFSSIGMNPEKIDRLGSSNMFACELFMNKQMLNIALERQEGRDSQNSGPSR